MNIYCLGRAVVVGPPSDNEFLLEYLRCDRTVGLGLLIFCADIEILLFLNNMYTHFSNQNVSPTGTLGEHYVPC